MSNQVIEIGANIRIGDVGQLNSLVLQFDLLLYLTKGNFTLQRTALRVFFKPCLYVTYYTLQKV